MSEEDNHCKDCCCARSWEALGITEYTGKSIPEHISELQAENERLKEIIGNVDALIAKGIIFTVDDVKQALKGDT